MLRFGGQEAPGSTRARGFGLTLGLGCCLPLLFLPPSQAARKKSSQITGDQMSVVHLELWQKCFKHARSNFGASLDEEGAGFPVPLK